jgi:hypothetical protein
MIPPEWGLAGEWTIGKEHATLGADGKPVRFRVTVDETAPGNNHGADINTAGEGVINEQRLYQLIRQKGPVTECSFQNSVCCPGVEIFGFRFG